MDAPPPCGCLLAGLALAGGGAAPAAAHEEHGPCDRPISRARATAMSRSGEELDAARGPRTLAAYDLFLARHADHPLAEIARRERAALAGPPR